MTTEELIEELKKHPGKEVWFMCYHEEKEYPVTEVILMEGDGHREPKEFVAIGQGMYLQMDSIK